MAEKAQKFWTSEIIGDQICTVFAYNVFVMKFLGVSCKPQKDLSGYGGAWIDIQQGYNRKLSRWWSW